MTVLQEDLDFLAHFGKKGMKWGVRNETSPTLKPKRTSGKVTRQVISDHNSMNNKEFRAKYAVTKKRYAKRFEKSNGDPYRENKLGQKLNDSKFGQAAIKNAQNPKRLPTSAKVAIGTAAVATLAGKGALTLLASSFNQKYTPVSVTDTIKIGAKLTQKIIQDGVSKPSPKPYW